MQELLNGWRPYTAQGLPPLGTFLAYVSVEPMIYIALRQADWEKPHFWTGTAWLAFEMPIAAWQPLPAHP